MDVKHQVSRAWAVVTDVLGLPFLVVALIVCLGVFVFAVARTVANPPAPWVLALVAAPFVFGFLNRRK